MDVQNIVQTSNKYVIGVLEVDKIVNRAEARVENIGTKNVLKILGLKLVF